MPEKRRHRRPHGQLALLAVVLILARVLAWEIHAVSAEHDFLHDCTVCGHADRSQDALPPAVSASPAIRAGGPSGATPVAPVVTGPVPAPAARGPPASLPV